MAEQARYVVRTPMALWLGTGAVVALVGVVLAGMIIFDQRTPDLLVLLALGACGASVAFWFGMNAYRVGGGRNLIRFYVDRIEVPAVRERKPLVFPRDGLVIGVRDVVVQYRMALFTVGSVKRGKLIELRRGTQTRSAEGSSALRHMTLAAKRETAEVLRETFVGAPAAQLTRRT